MKSQKTTDKTGTTKVVKKRSKKRRPSGSGPDLNDRGSESARKAATAILEVLAGELTPAQAATSLGVSVTRYYFIERYGLRGMIEGCEPRPRGRQDGPEKQMERLQKQVRTLERDLARYQALARVSSKAIGLKKSRGRPAAKRKRRPVVRALKIAEGLKQPRVLPEHDASKNVATEVA